MGWNWLMEIWVMDLYSDMIVWGLGVGEGGKGQLSRDKIANGKMSGVGVLYGGFAGIWEYGVIVVRKMVGWRWWGVEIVEGGGKGRIHSVREFTRWERGGVECCKNDEMYEDVCCVFVYGLCDGAVVMDVMVLYRNSAVEPWEMGLELCNSLYFTYHHFPWKGD